MNLVSGIWDKTLRWSNVHKAEVTLVLIELVWSQCGTVQCCIACDRLHHSSRVLKYLFSCIISKHHELCLPNVDIHIKLQTQWTYKTLFTIMIATNKNPSNLLLIKVLVLRQAQQSHDHQLSDSCYALSLSYPLMVAGTAVYTFVILSLQNPQVNYASYVTGYIWLSVQWIFTHFILIHHYCTSVNIFCFLT
jgi:hypothetical protein